MAARQIVIKGPVTRLVCYQALGEAEIERSGDNERTWAVRVAKGGGIIVDVGFDLWRSVDR